MTRPARADPCQAIGETRIEHGAGRRRSHRAGARGLAPLRARAGAGRAVVLLLHGISGSQQALAPVSGKSILMRDGHPGGWGPAPRWIRAIPACWRPMRWARVLAAARDAELPASFPDFTITDSVRLQGCGCARWALRGWMRWWAIPTAAIRRSSGRSIRPCHSGGRWRWRPGARRQLSDVIALRRLAAARPAMPWRKSSGSRRGGTP